MKYQAVTHTKMANLAERLGSKLLAVGAVESIIALAITQTPRGDIGSLTDHEIERWVGWTGKKGDLIAALIETRWLDECLDNRLIVHDWDEHAPEFIQKRARASQQNKALEPYFHIPVKHPALSAADSPSRGENSQYSVLSCPVLSNPVLSVQTHSDQAKPTKRTKEELAQALNGVKPRESK